MKKITCDIQDGDEAWTDAFVKDIEMLCGLTQEMFEENKVLLLSPIFRDLIAAKGRDVADRLKTAKHRLYIDNPGKPLTPRPVETK